MATDVVSEGAVEVRGGTLRYWRLDRGGQDTLLCLHGLGGDHRGLTELADALPGVNVVLPDLPGYGRSDPMSEVHSLVNYADAVADLRTALGLGTCHLLGHSLGASIALVHAARHGAGLASVSLLNPVSTASNTTATLGKLYYRIAAALPTPVARFWLASRPAVYIADWFVITTKDRARRRRILLEDYENYARASVPAMVQSFLSYYETPFEDHAERLTMPVLVVTGDKDRIAPAGAVTALADRMPNASVALLPGAGHLVPMEQPVEIAALVHDFIANAASTRSTVD